MFAGVWNFESAHRESNLVVLSPHEQTINCVSVNPWKYQIFYTTSNDGYLCHSDMEQLEHIKV